MGIGRSGSVSDVGSSDIQIVKVELSETKQKLEALLDVTEALWDVVQEIKPDLTEEQFKEKVASVKEKREDQKGQKNECPSCGMMNSKKIAKCMYCGHELEQSEMNSGVFCFRL